MEILTVLVLKSNPLFEVRWQQVIFITPRQESKPFIGIAKASEMAHHYCSTAMASSKSQISVCIARLCGNGTIFTLATEFLVHEKVVTQKLAIHLLIHVYTSKHLGSSYLQRRGS